MSVAAPSVASAFSTVDAEVQELAARAKVASRALATASTSAKNEALRLAADLLIARSDDICTANDLDVAQAQQDGISEGLIDRLRLDPGRIQAMADGLLAIAELRDPIGEITDGWTRPNGLRIERVRVPLGVVAIIYESRPNVTSDAAGLCIKAGNAAFLRGSSSAINSNQAIAVCVTDAAAKAGLPADSLILLPDTSREAAVAFMRQDAYIDCLIPRGGPSLIESVKTNATVPVIIDGAGNCHLYIDASADLEMATNILVNGKTQRPSVCNALESLVVHKDIANDFVHRAVEHLEGVELVGDAQAQQVSSQIGAATEEDFATEYLDLKMSIKVVDNVSDAIDHINANGTGHSEAIITSYLDTAEQFTKGVDAAAVLINASTRFVDGEEFGFGAEIGISTQKLHARGPMGLSQLTTLKFVVRGTGQVR